MVERAKIVLPKTGEATVTKVYTDGACLGNPGPGGWAWAIPGGRHASGCAPDTTNQKMELTAAYQALQAIEGPVELISDSTYVVHCFNEQWYENWEKRNWRTKKGPVANAHLWQPLIALYHRRAAELTFTWVKGHSGDEWNDVVDRLATEAAEAQTGRTGNEPPEMIGPADKPVRGDHTRPFPAVYAGTCGACGQRFPVGTLISRNEELGKYVHAGGCSTL